MEITDALDNAWQMASDNIIGNFELTEEEAERFAFYYENIYLM